MCRTAEQFVSDFEAGTVELEAFSVGACNACEECEESGFDAGGELVVEPFFSWHQCGVCGSQFGGDRYPAHYLDDGELCHVDICVDCLLYSANGDLPQE